VGFRGRAGKKDIDIFGKMIKNIEKILIFSEK